MVDSGIVSEFGMERRCKMPALFDQDRRFKILRQYANGGADGANDGGADEHGFQIRKAVAGREAHDAAFELTSVSVAFDGNVHERKRSLLRVRHAVCE